MARTCLIVVTARGKVEIGTYIPDDCVTILGRGTGVLLEDNGKGFVATNDHVIRLHKDRNLCTTVHIGLQNRKPFFECHDGYAYAAREFVDDGTGHAKLNEQGNPIPKNPLNDKDLALVRLSQSSYYMACADGRQFVKWSEVRSDAPNTGDRVYFRGYPTDNVDFVRELRSFGVDGYSLFSNVLDVSGNQIEIDGRESKVCKGNGDTKSDRDLHGISGSGLFDEKGRLVGIIHGGDPERRKIFACRASLLDSLMGQFT